MGQICNYDCFNCPYADCIRQMVLPLDIQDEMDREIIYDEGLLNSTNRKSYKYNHTEKGKVRARKYENKRLALQWLERYERIYKGTSKNTNARKSKAYRIRKLYLVATN